MPIFQDQKGKNISNFQKMIDEKKNTIRKYYDEIGHLYYGQYKDVNVDMTKDINAKSVKLKLRPPRQFSSLSRSCLS